MSLDIDPRPTLDTSSVETKEDVPEGVGPGPDKPQPDALQHTQLAALLSFKPSSRDVISGIAPHVLDDLHQRAPYRARRRSRIRNSSPDRGQRRASSVPRRSPLRLSAVVVLEDENAAIIQPENVVLELYPSVPAPSAPMSTVSPTETELNHTNKLSKRRNGNNHKSRIDRVLKSVTLVFRLK